MSRSARAGAHVFSVISSEELGNLDDTREAVSAMSIRLASLERSVRTLQKSFDDFVSQQGGDGSLKDSARDVVNALSEAEETIRSLLAENASLKDAVDSNSNEMSHSMDSRPRVHESSDSTFSEDYLQYPKPGTSHKAPAGVPKLPLAGVGLANGALNLSSASSHSISAPIQGNSRSIDSVDSTSSLHAPRGSAPAVARNKAVSSSRTSSAQPSVSLSPRMDIGTRGIGGTTESTEDSNGPLSPLSRSRRPYTPHSQFTGSATGAQSARSPMVPRQRTTPRSARVERARMIAKGSIGMFIEHTVIVRSMVPGGAADKVGLLQPGDVITEVQGTNTNGMSMGRIQQLILGPAGSAVTVKAVRFSQGESASPFAVKIVRMPGSRGATHGVTGLCIDRAVVVRGVTRGGAAATSGVIRGGDIMESIAGVACATQSLDAVRKRMALPGGVTLRMWRPASDAHIDVELMRS